MAGRLSPPSQDEGTPISEINVTPFVDVVLVLLVIFMVTAPVLMKDTLGLKLPKSSSGDSKAAPTSLGIAVTRHGQFLLAGRAVSEAELLAEAALALKKNSEVQALISADQDARHGDVVRAIDQIKSAGIQRFALQIERPGNPTGR
jgi:biopolymer transport protein ExbD